MCTNKGPFAHSLAVQEETFGNKTGANSLHPLKARERACQWLEISGCTLVA